MIQQVHELVQLSSFRVGQGARSSHQASANVPCWFDHGQRSNRGLPKEKLANEELFRMAVETDDRLGRTERT